MPTSGTSPTPPVPPDDHAKQVLYRDARITGRYDAIWQNTGKCVFCDLRDKYILYEEHGMALTISLFAYIDGHCMIVPRRHVTSVKDLLPAEWETVRKLLYMAKKIIKQTHGIRGMQLVQKDGSDAQSTVGHIHFHCVPFDAPDLSVWNVRRLQYTPLENVALYTGSKQLAAHAAAFDRKYGRTTQAAIPGGVAADTHANETTPHPKADITPDPYHFDWADLAFSSKKPINRLRATFIAAPRSLSVERFVQLVKQYLPKGTIVLGIAKEPFVDRLAGQPHFAMLRQETVQAVIDKVNSSPSKHKIYTVAYFQRETTHLLRQLDFARVLLVNGSWYQSFHTSPAYYALASRGTPFDYISPFQDETAARTYAVKLEAELTAAYPAPTGRLSEQAMMRATANTAKLSFDYTFQTGAVLGKKIGTGYRFLLRAWNAVVPYQTFALHYGSIREQHFTPPGDLSHYDTNHAEVSLLLAAQKQQVDLTGTTLFINLLPCPTCCRMLCQTGIGEVVYALDHSDGYAVNMLTAAGKTVRRVTIAD